MELQEFRGRAGMWLLVLGGCFLLGNLLGGIFLTMADGSGMQGLQEYLLDYFRLISDRCGENRFLAVVWGQAKPMMILGLFSVLPVRQVLMPAFFIVRGLLLGFSNACLFSVFGKIGLVLSGVLFLIPALFWVPAQFLFSLWALTRLPSVWPRAAAQTTKENRVLWEETGYLIICLVLMVLCIWLEYAVLPALVGGIVRVWLF